MKKLISFILSLAAVAMPVVAAAAPAPVAYRSTRWFDAVQVDGKKLDVTGRVIAGTIEKDVTAAQTYTVDGKAVTNYVARDSNMGNLRRHCDLSRRADGLSHVECGLAETVRFYPTIQNAQ